MCIAPQDSESSQNDERKHEDHKGKAKAQSAQSEFMQGSQLDLQAGLSIFLVDWDDTLFPTSALSTCGPEALAQAFEVIDGLIIELLEAVLMVPRSRVILLTNANIQWVFHAAKEFLPKFSKWLEEAPSNMMIASAHRPRNSSVDTQSPAYIAEMSQRKNRAVQQMSVSLQELINELRAHVVQVVSIGDSPLDLEAAHVLASILVAEQRYVKTVFMKPEPSVAELVQQHRALLGAVGKMAQVGRSFHQQMYQAQAPPPLSLKTKTPQSNYVQPSCATIATPSIGGSRRRRNFNKKLSQI